MTSGAEHHKIIVGVDFGTTFTGVSFISTAVGHVKDVSDIEVIADWPTPSGTSQEAWKTPSRLALAAENAAGRKKLTTDKYGFEVEPGLKSYSWFKLGLDKDVAVTNFDDPDFKSLEKSEGAGLYRYPPGWDAVDTCTAYLKRIYGKTMEVLGRRFTKEVLEVTPIEFWLTVPAIWSDKAKFNTRRAATRAGFGSRKGDKINLIPEPEAAAIAAISSLSRGESGDQQLNAGTGVMVCDCGGGTVDLTSYRITSTKPRPQFEELVIGVGGKCGSTYVDRKFHRWLSTMFSDAFENLPFAAKGPGSKLMKAFEDTKRTFGANGSIDQEFSATLVFPEHVRNGLPETRHYDPDEAEVIFFKSEMAGFFQPATDRIIELIEHQVQRAKTEATDCPIKMIILVGGFGDSNFLHAQIEQWCKANGGVQLICPPKPQAAVVRGAALRGLQGLMPVSRKCRHHYGFETSSLFRSGIDPPSKAWTDKWDGKAYCRDRIEWPIKQGDKIQAETSISTTLSWTHRPGRSLSGTLGLFMSDQETPPERTTDSGVKRVGIIEYDLKNIGLDQFPSKKHRGQMLQHLKFDVQVLLGHEHGTLDFRVVCDTKQCGAATIKYDGE